MLCPTAVNGTLWKQETRRQTIKGTSKSGTGPWRSCRGPSAGGPRVGNDHAWGAFRMRVVRDEQLLAETKPEFCAR
jgi:hypothetical protein